MRQFLAWLKFLWGMLWAIGLIVCILYVGLEMTRFLIRLLLHGT